MTPLRLFSRSLGLTFALAFVALVAGCGNGFKLTGHKQFVVQGTSSDMLIVAARTAGAAGETDGLTLFAVEKDAAGMSMEAARLVDATESPGQEESHARSLAAQFNASLICITAGERGAGLLRADHWTWVSARRVAVADTVGAGDAFLAAFLAGLLRAAHTDAEMLSAACRLGEWVASHPGATPDYDATTPS
jgi:hypothetical protein